MSLDLSKYKSATPPQSGGIDLSKYKTATPPPAAPAKLGKLSAFFGFGSGNSPTSDPLGEAAKGAVKSGASTLQGIGNMVMQPLNKGLNKFLGTNNMVGIPESALQSSNSAQQTGAAIEKVGEFLTPVGIEAGAAKLGAKLLPGIAKSTSFGAKALKLFGKGSAGAVEQGGKAAITGEDEQGVAASSALGAVSPLVPLAVGAAKGTAKAIKSTLNPEVEQALTRAIKPGTNNTRWDADLRLALPHIAQTAEQSGKPIKTIDELAGNVAQTKKRVWASYAEQLGPNVNQTIDGSPIADAMISSMNNRFVSQNPKEAQKIVQMAETYRREIPLGEAEDFLQSANNDLHSYYAKNKVGQGAAKADPSVGHVVAEADALRAELYKKLDSLTGSNAAELKRVYGALSNLQEAAVKRANVAARQNTDSLSEQLNFAQGLGKIGKSALNLNLGDAASGVIQMGSAKLLKEKNSTNGLIEHAFTKYSRKPVLPDAK